ncbi:MAG: amidase [Actinomycetota bacterium]|nr:amidase [Actinomycetota bacterium]
MPDSESPSETIGQSGIDPRAVTVSALTRALAAGQLSSVDLVRHYLGQIAARNGDLGAVITTSADAVDQAEAADLARSAGAATGPLAGIPVLLKDNISADGSPATAGSAALTSAAAADAFLVARLRAAGAIILGKANLSEWANFRSTHSSSGWSTLGGQAVNPRGAGRNPSGSSSGSGVAVAAGLAPLAVGTETDGSIVSPSNSCGVVGVKPTLGLVSRSGIVPISADQDTAGPMAGCVADAAVLLGAMAGADPADPATEQAAAQPADYTGFLDAGALDGARIGIWRDGSAAATPATAAVLDAAVALLRASGAVVIDPVHLADANKIGEPEFLALRHEFKTDLNAYLAAVGGEHPMSLAELIEFNSVNADRVLTHFGQEIFEQAEATGGRQDRRCQEARTAARGLARSALDGALAEHRLDAVVALTGSPAWLTDYVLGDHFVFATSSPAAVSGYPAITVPAGSVAGLPVGISLMGPAWSEPRLLALAYAYEQALAGQVRSA